MDVTIIVFGASGDLAKKKTFPALFGLYKSSLLPENLNIAGYARSDLTQSEFLKHVTDIKTNDIEALAKFTKKCSYLSGKYDNKEDFLRLKAHLAKIEGNRTPARIYYLALPPLVFTQVATMIKEILYLEGQVNRLVVEKPFGRDSQSSAELSKALSKLFREDEVYCFFYLVHLFLPVDFPNRPLFGQGDG